MKSIMKYWLLAVGMLLISSSCSSDEAKNTTENLPEKSIEKSTEKEAWRIVSLNGTITELLYEFELEDKIVGVDITSTYPTAAKSIANLGHSSQLNTEAILALKPNLILIDDKMVGNKALNALETSGIKIQVIKIPPTLEGSLEVAAQLEKVLGKKLETAVLKAKIAKNKETLETILSSSEEQPKVLFIYARGAQAMMVAGKNTFAESVIHLAGGNPIVQEFEEFKPLTPEALLEYQPEVILMFDSGLESLSDAVNDKSGEDQLLGIPGILQTPAGKNRQIISMEGLYLSGFGPRASDAVLELAIALHQKKLSLLNEVE
jgi:iron complex transport system substrate-binding protein